MLVLTMNADQRINIGQDIVVTIPHVAAGCVRMGVDVPRSVCVVRGELDALIDDPPHAPWGESVAEEGEEHERVST